MNSSREYNTFTLCQRLRVLSTCYCQIFNFVSCQRFTQYFSLTKLHFLRVICNSIQIFNHISVSVRVRVRKINSVIRILIIKSERMSVVTTWTPTFFRSKKPVRVIPNLLTCSEPAYISIVSHFFAVNQNFHTLIVKTVWFAKVEHVEAYRAKFIICGSEEKPLSMATCVNIILK
jgi:hypothetical protein